MNTNQLHGLAPEAFLQFLSEQDIELRLQDGRLRINAPEGAVTDVLKSEMTRRKDFLIEVCNTARSIHGSLVLRDPGADHNEAPLTHSQERIWLLERFRPANAAYNIPEVFEITAPLDPIILQQAINIIVRRHEILRVRIVETSYKVVQRVCSLSTIVVPIVDLRANPVDDTEAHLKALLRQESRRPFDLAVAPLARIQLYILDDKRRFLFINLHHIIADRSSTSILYRELLSIYLACERGITPALSPLPIQYADYAVWERSLSASRMKQQKGYWQQQLAHLPEPHALPFARNNAASLSSEGAVHSLRLSLEDTAHLRSFAKRQGASLYMVLLAAYCALLYRLTGMRDMCVGSPASERSFREVEPLIGLFVNTLVMRCRIPGRAGFVEIVRAVRETVLEAHANRDLPFQEVLNCLASNDINMSPQAVRPIFQTMLAFDPLPVDSSAATGSTFVELDPGFAKFDLTLQLREDSNCIHGWFEYRKDILSAEAISRFGTVFLRLLHDMLASPEKALLDIDIVSSKEKQLLLHVWNDTAMPFEREHTIHKMFAEQAERTPHKIAVIDGNRRLTYEQLDSASDCVAALLLDAGVQVEAIIGVQLPRTGEMVAAILGILKAGAAYLPIDAQYPSARIRSMLEDSACSIVLTDVAEADWSGHPVRLLQVPDVFNPRRWVRARTPVAATNLAYVLYTSGSTGGPKGVLIEHHSAVSFLTWGKNTFSPAQLQGTLASTSISFDLSIFEIFLPLTTGGSVILAENILQLPYLPSSKEVTLATTVPSAAAALLHSGDLPSSLKHLNLAGELLTDALLDRICSETQLESIRDLYGPTETTTYSTSAIRLRGQPATIGRPIANTRVYLLDESLRLVPVGMVGELFIAGEGVARGYLNRPELTRERFLSLAHLGEQGRAYRTGDLCRYNSDGTLVYQGRRDHQVKINGYRVEPGEIEAVLRTYPSIDDVVVIPQQVSGGVVLSAAVRGRLLIPHDVNELVRHQSALLPSHMVVRKFIILDAFPLLLSGKVDRMQLAAELASMHLTAREANPLSDELERQVLDIWRDAFLDNTISVEDDFFQIGGHSLLALRIFSDIEVKFGQRLMLSSLFQAPTVRALTDQLRVRQIERQRA